MAKASRSRQLDQSVAALWSRVGGWGTIHEWHPAIMSTQVSEDGSQRTLTLGGGGVAIEKLLEQGETSYSYQFEDSPLPVSGYSSTIRVHGDEVSSTVEWESTFEPVGISESEAVAVIEGLYQAGLDAL